MPSLESSRQQVSEPSFEKRDDSSDKEKPDSPSRSPNAHTWAFANWSRVEPVIDDVLYVLAHSYLSHHSVLVPINSCELTHMGVEILKTVGQLEGVDVSEPKLHIAVDSQFDDSEYLSAQMEGVAEPRPFPLLGGEGFDGFQVEVEVKMQVVQVFAVD